MTIIMQPVMELLGDGKVSHWYDWENIDKSKIKAEIDSLNLKSKSTQKRSFDKFSFNNIAASLGDVREAAIIKPKNYDGKWSLVFCNNIDNICQTGNILHTGEVKILLDGDSDLWGVTESGQYFSLQLVKLVDRSENNEILLI